jgi:putative membrane protein
LEPILAEAGSFRLPPPPELKMVSSRHVVRALAASVAPALLAIAVASVFFRPALFLLILLPVLGAGAALQRRFHRFALDGDLLFIARGVWRRRLWVVPVKNTQALSVERSWLQRRLGLASLSVDTAGAPAMKGARIVDLRLETAQALAGELAEARRAYSGRKSGTER